MLSGEAIPVVPPGLLAKYDQPVPRYTSYPAVPDWSGDVTGPDWLDHLGRLKGRPGPMALYVHLPFCAHRCFYCGCNATVTPHSEVVDRYLDRLEREIDRLADAMDGGPRIAEMHWGGGTPNFLDLDQLERLVRMLRAAFMLDARTECSIEADPRLVTPEQLETLRRLGFSRISFGVQDLTPEVQQAIGRVQPAAMVRDVVREARRVGFGGINLDLIYGLPRQTEATFAETLEGALALEPDRVACFGYAHLPWLRANQRRIDAATLPTGEERSALFHQAVRRFVDAGYEWLGLDHFALPTDPLALAAAAGRLHRNFMGYTIRGGEELLGIGTSAISEIDGWFVQHDASLGAWQRAVDQGTLAIERSHRMSADDQVRGRAVAELMCNGGLPFDLFVGDPDALTDRFEQFAEEGLLTFELDRVRVTPLGRFFLRNICAAVDGYRTADDGVRRFSRAV